MGNLTVFLPLLVLFGMCCGQNQDDISSFIQFEPFSNPSPYSRNRISNYPQRPVSRTPDHFPNFQNPDDDDVANTAVEDRQRLWTNSANNPLVFSAFPLDFPSSTVSPLPRRIEKTPSIAETNVLLRNRPYVGRLVNRVVLYVSQPRRADCCTNRVQDVSDGRITFPTAPDNSNNQRPQLPEESDEPVNIPLSDSKVSSPTSTVTGRDQTDRSSISNPSPKVAASTEDPSVNVIPSGPSRCVWAIVSCCTPKSNEVKHQCFELLGCHGPIWDTNPCDNRITQTAAQAALDFFNKG